MKKFLNLKFIPYQKPFFTLSQFIIPKYYRRKIVDQPRRYFLPALVKPILLFLNKFLKEIFLFFNLFLNSNVNVTTMAIRMNKIIIYEHFVKGFEPQLSNLLVQRIFLVNEFLNFLALFVSLNNYALTHVRLHNRWENYLMVVFELLVKYRQIFCFVSKVCLMN